jgi:hypothetical protein
MKTTITPRADAVKPIAPVMPDNEDAQELLRDHPAFRKDEPYTLSQIMANFELMKRTTDAEWCRWFAESVIERGIEESPTLLAALELDMAFHRRLFAITSLPDFKAAGYIGSGDANDMRDFLFGLKRSAIAKAKGQP